MAAPDCVNFFLGRCVFRRDWNAEECILRFFFLFFLSLAATACRPLPSGGALESAGTSFPVRKRSACTRDCFMHNRGDHDRENTMAATVKKDRQTKGPLLHLWIGAFLNGGCWSPAPPILLTFFAIVTTAHLRSFASEETRSRAAPCDSYPRATVSGALYGSASFSTHTFHSLPFLRSCGAEKCVRVGTISIHRVI